MRFDVWLDETERPARWIFSREEGDASYTVASATGDDDGYRLLQIFVTAYLAHPPPGLRPVGFELRRTR